MEILPHQRNVFIEEVIEKHRRIRDPQHKMHLGYNFVICPNVFSPFLAPSGRMGLSFSAWPIFDNRTILDVGCGSGISSCLMALSGAKKVVGVDINPYAIKNAEENVRNFGLGCVQIREGNLFDPLSRGEVFDIIYADLPFTNGDPNDELEKAFYDPGLSSIKCFLNKIPVLLTKMQRGSIAYLCLSNMEPFDYLFQEEELNIKLLITIEADFMKIHLYEIKLKRCFE